MISAQELKCLISTDTAVKGDVIYCSAPPTNGWEIAGFVVDAVAAGGTVAAVVVALWVAFDARKRVTEERQRAEAAERDSRMKVAGAKVVSAFSAHVDEIEKQDQTLFYAIGASIQNLAYSYGDDLREERDALCTALDRVTAEIFQPVFVGRMEVSVGSKSRSSWDLGIRFWKGRLSHTVGAVRNLFDALNATKNREVRFQLIQNFEYEMNLAARSLRASMENFNKGGRN